jgi:hypothetical protein
MSNTVVDDILEVFPTESAPEHVTNEIVQEKYMLLRVEIFELIAKMAKSENPKVSQIFVVSCWFQ